MKEYIKKFETATAADNYPISDIPFTTSIATPPIQNLVCNQENKKIVVDGDNIGIVNAGPKLISFKIRNNNYQAESGMKWGEWVESEYNTGGFYIDYIDLNNSYLIIADGGGGYMNVGFYDEIVNNMIYEMYHSGGAD